jgi:dynein heavy chain
LNGKSCPIQPAPIAWQQIKQTGSLPPPRSGHTIVTIGKTHYLFGGLEKPEKFGEAKDFLPKNDLYALRIVNNQQVEWTLKQCSGDVPLGRAFHSACKVNEDKMFIFGGCYTSNEKYNDTYYLKLRMSLSIQPPSNGSNLPTRNQWARPKTQCPKLAVPNPAPTTP